MGKSKDNLALKIFGYLLFCAITYVFTMAWAVGNFMNTKQNRDRTKYGFIFIFSLFVYISYLFWEKKAFIIPVLSVLYLTYNSFFINIQEAMYLLK
jgi:hypothetical protein